MHNEKEPGTATSALPRIMNGDDDAVAELVNHYEERILKFAKKKLANSSLRFKDENDAAQSVLWTFVNSFRQGKFPYVNNHTTFEAVTTVMLRNKIRDYLKSELRQKRGAGNVSVALEACNEIENDRAINSTYRIAMSEILELISNPRTQKVAELSMEGYSREQIGDCLLYTSPSPRDRTRSRMPSSA